MLSYTTTDDFFIRESTGNSANFITRIGIPKKQAFEIFEFCKSLEKETLKQMNFSQIKLNLKIPDYRGYELFLDIKMGRIELKGEKILVKKG
ncbi:MAG: hypothetical protein ACFE9L_11560 [Candidatus Hodarchaeota archaeon]